MPDQTYLIEFMDYATKHDIWFSVIAGQVLDQVTFLFKESSVDVSAYDDPKELIIGTKEALDWLRENHLLAINAEKG